MSKKVIPILACCLVVCAAIFVIFFKRTYDSNHSIQAVNNSERTNRSNVSDNVDETRKSEQSEHQKVVEGLEGIYRGLEKLGASRAGSIKATLQAAVDSGDTGIIRRAFNEAIYGRVAIMAESQKALESFLTSTNLFARYFAAETLIKIGASSGVEVLIDLVGEKDPVIVDGIDLRIEAGKVLGKFGIDAASDDLLALFSRTRDSSLLRPIASLGLSPVEAQEWRYVESALAIERYAMRDDQRFLSDIETTFNSTNDADVKNAAAWALARMTGDTQYVEFLIEAAMPAVQAFGRTSYSESTMAVKYLGSIDMPEAVEFLERTLWSANPIVVEYSTVSLLFNQSQPSAIAEESFLRHANEKSQMIDVTLTMQIAAKLDDHVVGGLSSDVRSSEAWRYFVVARNEWPIENWIHNYVASYD